MAKADQPHHEYKLNENTETERMSLEGVVISKEWRRFEYPKKQLNQHIQTRNNMKGIVDYRVIIPSQSRIVKSNKERVTKKIPFYTKRELQTMTREELIEIAETYEFTKPNFTGDRVLVDKIFQYQKEIRQEAKERQFIDDDENKQEEPTESEKELESLTEIDEDEDSEN